MQNLFIIFDRKETSNHSVLQIVGFTTRNIAHTFGTPHAAVQVFVVIPVKTENGVQPQILLHKRSKHKKIDPGKWDICGGHLEVDDQMLAGLSGSSPQTTQSALDLLTKNWNNHPFIERLFWEAAVREVNEEVQFKQLDFQFERKHLKGFGAIGAFKTGFDNPLAINREYSGVFLAFVPVKKLLISTEDELSQILKIEDTVSIDGKVVEEEATEIRLTSFESLMDDFLVHSKKYADGVSRVLARLAGDAGLKKEFRALVYET